MAQRLSLLAAALWWGSLSSLGLVVVPLLFKHLPTAAAAGAMAARLFSAQTWVCVVCALCIVMMQQPRASQPEGASNAAQRARITGLALAGMLLALLGEFAIAPRIVARSQLALWHTLGTVNFAVQWLLALGALLLQAHIGKTGKNTAAGEAGEH